MKHTYGESVKKPDVIEDKYSLFCLPTHGRHVVEVLKNTSLYYP